jgi:single-stranded-DNA-specific exonuclease
MLNLLQDKKVAKGKTMDKKWQIAPKINQSTKNKFPEINPIILQLLFNRGLGTQEKIDEFLNPDYGQDIHDPFLFRDMNKAVDRILKAIKKKEKIVVYGDYDADGVCATVLLAEVLKELGALPEVYIPYRNTEGYGLNDKAVEELSRSGTKLIITVDCGISNKNEIEKAKKNGIEVIITDHHYEPKELPKAFATINPKIHGEKYPFDDLAGVGVAFKLAQALLKTEKNINQGFEKWLLDLVALGTVTDIADLLGENRTLVRYGLIVLKKTKRLGLLELLKAAQINPYEIDSRVIGYYLGPRLNAAGRLDHASTAYQLLITEDENEAKKIAQDLDGKNRQRQKMTKKIVQEALKQIGKIDEKKKLLTAIGESWPAGVVGLVAGKIADQYYRPTLIMERGEYEIIGSGRSIEEFNLIRALQKMEKYLSRYGGHAQACGFTMTNEKNLEKFRAELEKIVEEELKGKELYPKINIDLEIDLEEVNWDLYENTEKFEPFGEANQDPVFLAKNLKVVGIECVGQDGKHLRLQVNHNTRMVKKAIGFNFGYWSDKINVGDKIDMVFKLEVNQWNGSRELQLKVVDLKLS